MNNTFEIRFSISERHVGFEKLYAQLLLLDSDAIRTHFVRSLLHEICQSKASVSSVIPAEPKVEIPSIDAVPMLLPPVSEDHILEKWLTC